MVGQFSWGWIAVGTKHCVDSHDAKLWTGLPRWRIAIFSLFVANSGCDLGKSGRI